MKTIQTVSRARSLPRRYACTTLWLALTTICILLVAAGGVAADSDKSSMINCDIQDGPCTQSLDGRMVTLDIQPRPVKAMQDLTFKVSTDYKPALSASPLIRLNMPAMDMGKNQVSLKRVTPGVFQGVGVIVRCRSGRRTWKATVVMPELGTVDFIFDVIY